MWTYREQIGRWGQRLLTLVVLLVVAAGAANSVRADEVVPRGGQGVAPVPRLFERVHSSFAGRILKVELAHSNPPAYEVKLLTEAGNVLKLSYNAQTLRLESVVGHRDRNDGSGEATVIVRGDDVRGRRVDGDDDEDDDDGDDDDDDRDDDDRDNDDRDDDDRDDDRDDRDDDRDRDRDGGNSGPGGGDD